MAYSKKTYEKIENVLEKMKWKYEVDEREDRCLIRTGMYMDEDRKISKIVILFNIQEDDVSVIATSAIKADTKNKVRMAEFLSRANDGLKDGNFEFDYDEGKIRYKSYIYVNGRDVEEDEILHSILVVASMWDVYGDGIVEVLGSEKEPKEIISKIEKVELE